MFSRRHKLYPALRHPRKLANVALNELERVLRRERLLSMPQVVDVVLTKACNLACQFCKDYQTPSGARRIAVDNFERAASQLLPTARRLDICSGGEPYLHTGLEQILRIAKRHGIYTWVLSNGMILREGRLRDIVRERLVDEHGFSVDGIKPSTVESIRVNANLGQILDNIDMVIKLRRTCRLRTPRITIRYALMRRNIDELPAAVEYWGTHGADRIDAGWLSVSNEMDPKESLFFHQALTEQVFKEARTVASRFRNLELRLPATIGNEGRQRASVTDCHQPWSFVMIDANGQIMPCYRSFEALRFGKIYDAEGLPFRAVWNSDPYLALRRTVNDDSCRGFYPYCASCELRKGYATEDAHLGEATWKRVLGPAWVSGQLNHRRPLKGSAARERA